MGGRAGTECGGQGQDGGWGAGPVRRVGGRARKVGGEQGQRGGKRHLAFSNHPASYQICNTVAQPASHPCCLHCDSQNGLSYRRPSVIRFVYADRPTWWPDSIAYSCDAFKVMGRDVLEPLHKTIITVGRRITCGRDTGAGYFRVYFDLVKYNCSVPVRPAAFHSLNQCCYHNYVSFHVTQALKTECQGLDWSGLPMEDEED